MHFHPVAEPKHPVDKFPLPTESWWRYSRCFSARSPHRWQSDKKMPHFFLCFPDRRTERVPSVSQNKLPPALLFPEGYRTASAIPAVPEGFSHSWNTPPEWESPISAAAPSPPGNGKSWYFQWQDHSHRTVKVHSPVRCIFPHRPDCHPPGRLSPPPHTSRLSPCR